MRAINFYVVSEIPVGKNHKTLFHSAVALDLKWGKNWEVYPEMSFHLA